MDRGEATLLHALDIPAAFDTLVHSTLVQWLHSSYGVDGNILTWIVLLIRAVTVCQGRISICAPIEL